MPSNKHHDAGKTRFERTLTASMKMDEATWLRHANPWSVWTRFSCLPLLCLAIWSRQWISYYALIPIFFALLWTWINPRAFPPPETFKHWPARATFGERVWLNRSHVPIPPHHERAAFVIMVLMVPGLSALAYGLFVLSLWPTLLGLALTVLTKVWFCDRMVWLYEDMSRTNAVYASWSRPPVNDNSDRQAA